MYIINQVCGKNAHRKGGYSVEKARQAYFAIGHRSVCIRGYFELCVADGAACNGDCRAVGGIPLHLTLIAGGKFVRIVVIKSPKALSGLLRLIFKIKKKEDT